MRGNSIKKILRDRSSWEWWVATVVKSQQEKRKVTKCGPLLSLESTAKHHHNKNISPSKIHFFFLLPRWSGIEFPSHTKASDGRISRGDGNVCKHRSGVERKWWMMMSERGFKMWRKQKAKGSTCKMLLSFMVETLETRTSGRRTRWWMKNRSEWSNFEFHPRRRAQNDEQSLEIYSPGTTTQRNKCYFLMNWFAKPNEDGSLVMSWRFKIAMDL